MIILGPTPTQEVFRNPRDAPFTYSDRQDALFEATNHDPVARGIVDQARQRYTGLQALYVQILGEVQAEARNRVSR